MDCYPKLNISNFKDDFSNGFKYDKANFYDSGTLEEEKERYSHEQNVGGEDLASSML